MLEHHKGPEHCEVGALERPERGACAQVEIRFAPDLRKTILKDPMSELDRRKSHPT